MAHQHPRQHRLLDGAGTRLSYPPTPGFPRCPTSLAVFAAALAGITWSVRHHTATPSCLARVRPFRYRPRVGHYPLSLGIRMHQALPPGVRFRSALLHNARRDRRIAGGCRVGQIGSSRESHPACPLDPTEPHYGQLAPAVFPGWQPGYRSSYGGRLAAPLECGSAGLTGPRDGHRILGAVVDSVMGRFDFEAFRARVPAGASGIGARPHPHPARYALGIRRGPPSVRIDAPPPDPPRGVRGAARTCWPGPRQRGIHAPISGGRIPSGARLRLRLQPADHGWQAPRTPLKESLYMNGPLWWADHSEINQLPSPNVAVHLVTSRRPITTQGDVHERR